jgi:two-component system response regulator PilR (NtrC family)
MLGQLLIVEDYADWRDLIKGMLVREGHHVVTAGTLTEARRILAEQPLLDLAILDIRLVEMDDDNEDGMQLLSEIRQSHAFTRVIMLTGHGTMEKQRKAFREFRAFDFFRKEQFDSDEFRRAVREAVEEAARDRQNSREEGYMHRRRFHRWQGDANK